MEVSSLVFIAAVEVGALLALLCGFLLLKNRSLRKLISRLQERLEKLIQDLRRARDQRSGGLKKPKTYRGFVELELEATQAHHKSLHPEQDIVLDIDPSVPLPRRAAALRHAILSIELEASPTNTEEPTNWHQMNRKYEQLFSFQQDYAPADELVVEGQSEEVEMLNEELKAAKKRVDSLEKFRTLYLELEERWQECQNSAKGQFDELSGMVARIDDASQSESLMGALDAYQSTYSAMAQFISDSTEQQPEMEPRYAGDSSGEVRQLRAVAADQHRIIAELQRKLASAESDAQLSEAVDELKAQLDKQMRFVQESEACIQLMEEELHTANKELELMKARQSAIPQLKAELKELRDACENYETQVYTLRASNQRLSRDMKKLKSQTADRGPGGDSQKLKKQLLEMEAKYADLEEKFLDLKLGS